MARGQPCPLCEKTVTNLKNHLLVHSGEKPYDCEECGKVFGKAFDLKMHIRLCQYLEKSLLGKIPMILCCMGT